MRQRRVSAGQGEGEGDVGAPVAPRQNGRNRCGGWCTAILIVLLAAAALILLLSPARIDPIAFRFSERGLSPFEGELEVNSELQRAKLLFPGELVKPEAFVRDREGYIYTGLGDGRLVCLSPNLSEYTTVLRMGQPPYDDCGSPEAEDRCGRILGLHLHPTDPDILFAADSSFGLLQINVSSRQVEILVTQGRINDEEVPFINFSNDLVALDNGSIFFTDSSKKIPRCDVIMEVYECQPNGQLLHFDLHQRKVYVSLDGIHFPNGVCLSRDGTTTLLFAETTRARIMRYYLSGPKAGSTDVFLDNLPGLPDNISPNIRGDGYWIAFAATRTIFTDYMAQLPTLRALIVKLHLARFIAHRLPKHTLVIEVDTAGRILRSLHDPGGRVLESVSHVLDLGDRLLLGSYEAPHAAVLTLE